MHDKDQDPSWAPSLPKWSLTLAVLRAGVGLHARCWLLMTPVPKLAIDQHWAVEAAGVCELCKREHPVEMLGCRSVSPGPPQLLFPLPPVKLTTAEVPQCGLVLSSTSFVYV